MPGVRTTMTKYPATACAAGTGERFSTGAGLDPSNADILRDHIEGVDGDALSDDRTNLKAAVAHVHDLAADDSNHEDEAAAS